MNCLRFIVILCFSLVAELFALSVDFKDEQVYNSSMLALRMRVVNELGTPLRNIKLRYLFTKKSEKQIVLDTGYTAGARVSLEIVNDTLGYVEIQIDSIIQGFFPNSSGFYQGLHYSDWSALEKQSHPSYINVSDFIENSNVLLYRDDVLVYGNAPFFPVEKPKLKIVGFQPEGNAWIDIKNYGHERVSLNGVSLTGLDSVEHDLGTISLDTGEIIRVCKWDSACGEFEKKIILPSFPWDSVGEAMLKRDSVYLAYIPWGREGVFADEAVSAGVWKQKEDYFASAEKKEYYPVQYVENAFYRVRENERGAKTDDWFSYTDRDNPSTVQFAPSPVKLTMVDSVNYRLTENDSVTFKWIPVERVRQYKVVIRNLMNNVVREITTSGTSVNVFLEDGNYSWLVYCGEYVDEDGNIRIIESNGISPFSPNMALISKNVDVNVWNALNIDTIVGFKDTRFLFLGYGQKSAEYKWDALHTENPFYSNSYRCWLVASQLMNHIYGGNITQDEILYAVRFNNAEPLISPFFPVGADPEEDVNALKFALNTDSVFRYEGAPSYEIVRNEIDNGRPIYIGTVYWSKNDSLWKGHAMVVYGYVGDRSNYAFLYAFGDNLGMLTNSIAKPDSIEYYILTKPVYGSVAFHDSRLDVDSDGDGITDFDEEERFGTNPYDYDTDGDGKDDKKEIFDYTVKSRYDESLARTFPDIAHAVQIKILEKSDADNDSIRAESDNDDNNNGINDGLEGETALSIDDMNVPLDYTLFARGHLVVNDGVECYDSDAMENVFCRIGTGGKNIFSYNSSRTSLLLGVGVHVGTVDAHLSTSDTGKVFLRNSAVIHGDLNMYVLPANAQVTTVVDGLGSYEKHLKRQSNVVVLGNINLKYNAYFPNRDGSWEGNYQCNLSNIDSVQYGNNKVVKNGETFVLLDGAAYKSLKVESGGTIVFSSGEFFIDSLLQLESNSKIDFLIPGESSILHLNGKIIWRPNSDYSLTNSVYWSNVARGFKLVQHSSKFMYIEGFFGGTIYAPLSKLILGQVHKRLYGRFFAKDITVHQYTKMIRVDYNPIENPSYAIWRR
ncbi:MAG: hypothetical protein IKZ45_04655 [Fibrobacter sp.]|nr:hypothetical protein [Fibrobacter sp.]